MLFSKRRLCIACECLCVSVFVCAIAFCRFLHFTSLLLSRLARCIGFRYISQVSLFLPRFFRCVCVLHSEKIYVVYIGWSDGVFLHLTGKWCVLLANSFSYFRRGREKQCLLLCAVIYYIWFIHKCVYACFTENSIALWFGVCVCMKTTRYERMRKKSSSRTQNSNRKITSHCNHFADKKPPKRASVSAKERDRIKPKYVFWILWKFGTSGILIYRFYKCMYGCAHANIQTVNIQFCGLCIIFLVMFHIFLLRSFNGDSNGENFGGWECRWKSTEKFPLIILFTCSFFSLSRPFFR